MASINDTVKVRRGGTILHISKNLVDRYMAKGFDVVDDKGNIVQASVPNDVTTLKLAYETHIAQIKKLETELSEARQEIEKLKAEPVKQSKLFGTEDVEPVTEEPVEKKTGKRSKK